MSKLQQRSDFYRSAHFKAAVAVILRREPADVAVCVDALLEAGRIAVTAIDLPAAMAVSSDAASILSAVASRQRAPASVVRVTARICAMDMQFEMGRGASDRAATEPPPAETFCGELANLFRHLWSEAAKAVPFVSVSWSEGGTALFGITDHSQAGGGKRLFSDVRLPVPLGGGAGDWDFVRLPAVGGSLFSPPSIAGFARLAGEILNHATKDDDHEA